MDQTNETTVKQQSSVQQPAKNNTAFFQPKGNGTFFGSAPQKPFFGGSNAPAAKGGGSGGGDAAPELGEKKKGGEAPQSTKMALGGAGAAEEGDKGGGKPLIPNELGASTDTAEGPGGGGSIAEYLRQLSLPAFNLAKEKIGKLAGKLKENEPASKKAKQAEKAAKAPSKEGQSKANSKQVKRVGKKPKPKTDKAIAKSNFRSQLESNMPKKVKDVLDFKKSKKAKRMGKAAMDAIAVDKNKITSTYAEAKTKPPALPNTPPTPLPALEKAETIAPLDLGKNMIGQLKPEHTDFSSYQNQTDQKLAQEGITETHLQMVDSGDLAAAKQGRDKMKQTATSMPTEANKVRQEKMKGLEQDLQAEEQKGRAAMHEERMKELGMVRETQTKSQGGFEQEREKVTSHINGIYEGARKRVEQRLGDLEQKAFKDFERGQAQATEKFENNVDREMKDLKSKRYKGLRGKGRWLVDKVLGIGRVQEVKDLIEKNRTTYINEIDQLVETISQRNEQVISECRQTISDAEKQIDEYVDKLPDNLKKVGEQAEGDIQKKLDDLEQKINEKEEALQEQLAAKRDEAIEAIDKKIEEMKKEMGGILSNVLQFLADAALKFLRWALESAGIDPEPFIATLKKFGGAIKKIITNPIGFLSNLIKAVGGGFKQFGQNAGQYLKEGAMSWLKDKLEIDGLEMPAEFNLQGIMKMVLSILGVSWTNIKGMFNKAMGDGQFVDKIAGGMSFAKTVVQEGPASMKNMAEEEVEEKLTEKLGADRMDQIMLATDLIKDVSQDGPQAILPWIKEKGGELKDMAMEEIQGIKTQVLGGIKDWIKTKVIQEGIKKLLSFLTPAGGIVSAIVSIYKSIQVFFDNRSELKQLFSTIINSIGLAIDGDIGGASAMISQALQLAIPIILNFVSKLLNLDGVFKTIQKVVGKVKDTVNGLLEKVINFIAKIIKKVWGKIKGWIEKMKGKFLGGKKDEGADTDPNKKTKADGEKEGEEIDAEKVGKPNALSRDFTADNGDHHKLFIEKQNGGEHYELMIHSRKRTYEDFINHIKIPEGDIEKKEAKAALLILVRRLDSILDNRDQYEDLMAELEPLFDEIYEQTRILFQISKSSIPVFKGVTAGGFGVEADIEYVTKRPYDGAPGSGTGGIMNESYRKIDQRKVGAGTFYIRGHLLSEKLHGPGMWENLTPLTRAGNSEHEDQIEDPLKVGTKLGKAYHYTVTPKYDRKRNDTLLNQIDDSTLLEPEKDIAREIIETEKEVPSTLIAVAKELDPETGDVKEGGENYSVDIKQDLGDTTLDNYQVSISPKPSLPIHIGPDSTLENLEFLFSQGISVNILKAFAEHDHIDTWEELAEVVPYLKETRLLALESEDKIHLNVPEATVPETDSGDIVYPLVINSSTAVNHLEELFSEKISANIIKAFADNPNISDWDELADAVPYLSENRLLTLEAEDKIKWGATQSGQEQTTDQDTDNGGDAGNAEISFPLSINGSAAIAHLEELFSEKISANIIKAFAEHPEMSDWAHLAANVPYLSENRLLELESEGKITWGHTSSPNSGSSEPDFPLKINADTPIEHLEELFSEKISANIIKAFENNPNISDWDELAEDVPYLREERLLTLEADGMIEL